MLWTLGIAAACVLLGVALARRVAHRVRPASERARDEVIESAEAARRAAVDASRAKDRVLAMLGHELRNPLNAIVTSVEVLRAAAPGSAVADSARGVLGRQTHKLTRLVDDLLDAAQVMADEVRLTKRPVDLRELIGRSIDASRPLAGERSQSLQLDAPAPVWVEADTARLEQAMAHLLENAVKATPPGGVVTVRLAVVDGEAVVCVEDSGPGIVAESLQRDFEPFAPGAREFERSGAGLGIGFAIAQRLIELHGGSIRARSSPQGSRFEWRLPAIAGP
jgi:signal transduction histidine kinase